MKLQASLIFMVVKGFRRAWFKRRPEAENVKMTRAVHALDAGHLDVGGGGRAGEEGGGRVAAEARRAKASGTVVTTFAAFTTQTWIVRHKGERRGGPGRGQPSRTMVPVSAIARAPSGEDAVEAVEFRRREVVVGCDLEALGQEVCGEVSGTRMQVGVVVLQCVPTLRRDLAGVQGTTFAS